MDKDVISVSTNSDPLPHDPLPHNSLSNDSLSHGSMSYDPLPNSHDSLSHNSLSLNLLSKSPEYDVVLSPKRSCKLMYLQISVTVLLQTYRALEEQFETKQTNSRPSDPNKTQMLLSHVFGLVHSPLGEYDRGAIEPPESSFHKRFIVNQASPIERFL